MMKFFACLNCSTELINNSDCPYMLKVAVIIGLPFATPIKHDKCDRCHQTTDLVTEFDEEDGVWSKPN